MKWQFNWRNTSVISEKLDNQKYAYMQLVDTSIAFMVALSTGLHLDFDQLYCYLMSQYQSHVSLGNLNRAAIWALWCNLIHFTSLSYNQMYLYLCIMQWKVRTTKFPFDWLVYLISNLPNYNASKNISILLSLTTNIMVIIYNMDGFLQPKLLYQWQPCKNWGIYYEYLGAEVWIGWANVLHTPDLGCNIPGMFDVFWYNTGS